MYQFSRAMYRELAPHITGCSDADAARSSHERVLRACESAVERMANDRRYFARPARTLFNDIRTDFPMCSQPRVFQVVQRYVTCADEYLARQPRYGTDAQGNPIQCRATTRRGTPCQRDPLPHNGYCPSHQHLAETEDLELSLATADIASGIAA